MCTKFTKNFIRDKLNLKNNIFILKMARRDFHATKLENRSIIY